MNSWIHKACIVSKQVHEHGWKQHEDHITQLKKVRTIGKLNDEKYTAFFLLPLYLSFSIFIHLSNQP